MERLRIGVSLDELKFLDAGSGQEVLEPDRILHLAEEAERLSFDSLWVGDHVMFHHPILEPQALLAAFAARTRRVTLGTGILLLPLRHPVLVAKLTAAIDILSGGRLVVGVGVGGEYPKEFEACGVRVQERGRRADEGIEVLRRLWTESDVTHHGAFYPFEGVTLAPRPLQRPHPPIWIGGRTDASLRRAARWGDGWIPYFVTPERYGVGYRYLLDRARERGRDPSAIVPACFLFAYTSEDVGEARRKASAYLTRAFRQPADHLLDRYCVLGPPAECAATIERFVRAGAREIILSALCGSEEVVHQMEIWAREVVPALQQTGTPHPARSHAGDDR